MLKLLALLLSSAAITWTFASTLDTYSKRNDANARSAYVCPRTMTDPITVKTPDGWLIVCVHAPEIKQ